MVKKVPRKMSSRAQSRSRDPRVLKIPPVVSVQVSLNGRVQNIEHCEGGITSMSACSTDPHVCSGFVLEQGVLLTTCLLITGSLLCIVYSIDQVSVLKGVSLRWDVSLWQLMHVCL